MLCFVSFRSGSEPEVYKQPDECLRVIGKVLKGRLNIGGTEIPTYSPGKDLFQVSINRGPSYLANGGRIVVAPRNAVFIQALLPIILPVLYPLPRRPEIVRIARVLYSSMLQFLPEALACDLLSMRGESWKYLDKRQLALIEHSGGQPIFIPTMADSKVSAKLYKRFKVDRDFGYAVFRASEMAEPWYRRLTTIGSLHHLEVVDDSKIPLVFKLTAPLSDPVPSRLPRESVQDLLVDVVKKRELWLPTVTRRLLTNIRRLYV